MLRLVPPLEAPVNPFFSLKRLLQTDGKHLSYRLRLVHNSEFQVVRGAVERVAPTSWSRLFALIGTHRPHGNR